MTSKKKQSYLDIEDVIQPFWRQNSISFAKRNPHLVAEWCMSKNCGWSPDDFTHASTVKAWWICPKCNLEYKQVIHCRNTGHGCPFCASQRVSINNCFAVLFDDIAKQWHPTKNRPHLPSEFTWGSNFIAWWICPVGKDHIWQAPISHRTSQRSESSGCPFCSSSRTSITNSLASLHPELLLEWHPTKNHSIQPKDLTARSTIKVWWLCHKGHSWLQSPEARVRGYGCGFCAGKKVAPENSLLALFPKVAQEWHPTKNANLSPKDFTAKSGKKVWWQCRLNPSHEWDAVINNRTGVASGCPYCSGAKVSSTNSFASRYPVAAASWHPTKNGNVTPQQVAPTARAKYWWLCDKNPEHEWLQSPHIRAQTTNCPICKQEKLSVKNEAENNRMTFPSASSQGFSPKSFPTLSRNSR